jgi:hypothetical protein
LRLLQTGGHRLCAADWTEYNPTLEPPNCLTGRGVARGALAVLAALQAVPLPADFESL